MTLCSRTYILCVCAFMCVFRCCSPSTYRHRVLYSLFYIPLSRGRWWMFSRIESRFLIHIYILTKGVQHENVAVVWWYSSHVRRKSDRHDPRFHVIGKKNTPAWLLFSFSFCFFFFLPHSGGAEFILFICSDGGGLVSRLRLEGGRRKKKCLSI